VSVPDDPYRPPRAEAPPERRAATRRWLLALCSAWGLFALSNAWAASARPIAAMDGGAQELVDAMMVAGALRNFAPLAGGLLGLFLPQPRLVVWGLCVDGLGVLCLLGRGSLPAWLPLVLMALGGGIVAPNLLALVAGLYRQKQRSICAAAFVAVLFAGALAPPVARLSTNVALSVVELATLGTLLPLAASALIAAAVAVVLRVGSSTSAKPESASPRARPLLVALGVLCIAAIGSSVATVARSRHEASQQAASVARAIGARFGAQVEPPAEQSWAASSLLLTDFFFPLLLGAVIAWLLLGRRTRARRRALVLAGAAAAALAVAVVRWSGGEPGLGAITLAAWLGGSGKWLIWPIEVAHVAGQVPARARALALGVVQVAMTVVATLAYPIVPGALF
jgi:hypothetical protein